MLAEKLRAVGNPKLEMMRATAACVRALQRHKLDEGKASHDALKEITADETLVRGLVAYAVQQLAAEMRAEASVRLLAAE